MGEEVKIDDSVAEWEAGLPSVDDLTPLSQSLIPAELALAFKITPEPPRTVLDVNRASQITLSSIRGGGTASFKPFGNHVEDHVMVEAETEDGSDPKRSRRTDPGDYATIDNFPEDQSTAAAAKTLKRPRLVWTPQLHKRFVDVVAHLGLKNAVPKTIMQLMNVEGLTRENVASHLQKYRLYVKRMQGLSDEGPSPSDHLFASTPVPPQSLNESSSGPSLGNGHANGSHHSVNNGSNGNNKVGMPVSMPYPPPPPMMPIPMPMPMVGMAVGNGNSGSGFHGYDAAHSHHHHHHYQQQYGALVQQQREWSSNSYNSYPHQATPNK